MQRAPHLRISAAGRAPSFVPHASVTASLRPLSPIHSHQFSSLAPSRENDTAATSSLGPRRLSDLQSRIGKCITFGLSSEQQQEAGSICAVLARDWRQLVAGSEGFLTEPNRRGLWRQDVAWGEMDSMGHVNNVSYNRYAESARMNWALNFATRIDPARKAEWMELWTPKGTGLILRSIRTDYKFPMKFPDHVTVLHKLRSRPSTSTDSFILDVIILSELHRRPAARCVEDIVCYDYRIGKKSALPSFMAETLSDTFRLQEEAKTKWGSRVKELIARVKTLEQQSWDRPDAKEDLGTAAGTKS